MEGTVKLPELCACSRPDWALMGLALNLSVQIFTHACISRRQIHESAQQANNKMRLLGYSTHVLEIESQLVGVRKETHHSYLTT